MTVSELASRVLPIAEHHAVVHVSLIPSPEGDVQAEGIVHLLVDADASNREALASLREDLQKAIGKVNLYTLEDIRHSPYAKEMIRSAIILDY